MNVYDKARELARAVRECDEYREVRRMAERIGADAESRRMLDDFRKKQTDFQQKAADYGISGGIAPKEELEKMEKLVEAVIRNDSIRGLFDAERRLSFVMEDVRRILDAPWQDMYK